MQVDPNYLGSFFDSQDDTVSSYFANIPFFHDQSTQNWFSPLSFMHQASEHYGGLNTVSDLAPTDVDMHFKENKKNHSTLYYDLEGLVLRRGQVFTFTATFDPNFNADEYHLSVIFKSETWVHLPEIRIPLDGSSYGWSAKRILADDLGDNQISFRIDSPSDATIGKYSLFLDISSKEDNSINEHDSATFQIETDVYLLFNPWQKDDICALPSAEHISEYLTNEHGQIYLGSSDVPRSIPWYFGQFEGVVLLAALTLLSRADISKFASLDSLSILRILASNICSNRDGNNGIFPSSSDLHPFAYQGSDYASSVAILKEYLLSNGQSLQGSSENNWQHAAVFCSLCRSLGIPSRLVTVYNAAYGDEAEENEPNVDWNTRQRLLVLVNSKITRPWYVWNECWMRRDDLPKENSGWQVVDTSSGQSDSELRRTGPCSVAALKCGTLDFKWDAPKIHNILNGKTSCWVVYPDGSKKLNTTDEHAMNTKILTKSLQNDHEYEDITSNYKSIQSSSSDRTSLNNDVDIQMKAPDSVKFGDSLNLSLLTNNLSSEHRTLTVSATLIRTNCTNYSKSTLQEFYRTIPLNQRVSPDRSSYLPIGSSIQTVELDPNQHNTIPINIANNHQVWAERFDSLLKLHIHATIRETGQIYQSEKYISNDEFIKMKLRLDNDVIEIEKPAKAYIYIDNSFSYPLDNARITIDGFGVSESFSIMKELSSSTSAVIPVEFVPLRLGVGRLYATFSTDIFSLSPQAIPLEVVQSTDESIEIIDHDTTLINSHVQPIENPDAQLNSMADEMTASVNHQNVTSTEPLGEEIAGPTAVMHENLSQLTRPPLEIVIQIVREVTTTEGNQKEEHVGLANDRSLEIVIQIIKGTNSIEHIETIQLLRTSTIEIVIQTVTKTDGEVDVSRSTGSLTQKGSNT